MVDIEITKLKDELKHHEKYFCYCGQLLKKKEDVELGMHSRCAGRINKNTEFVVVEKNIRFPELHLEVETPACNLCSNCKVVDLCGGVQVAVNTSGDDTGKPSEHAHEIAEQLGIDLIMGWRSFKELICDKNQMSEDELKSVRGKGLSL